MKDLARTLSWMILVLAVAACTVKGKPYREHDEDKRQTRDHSEIIAKPESATPSGETGRWEANFNSAKDPLLEVVVPLADRVLDPKRVADKNSLITRAIMDELIMFNRLLLKIPKEQRSRAEFQALLIRYKSALETECEEFTSSCSGLHYFQLSAHSEQVAKLIAQNDPSNYFRMLLFAIKLKNAFWDAEIVRMMFENPVRNLSQAESKRRDTVKSLMGTALQTARDKNGTPEAQREFLESIHAWKLADGDIQSFDPSTQSSLFEMIANSRYMYKQGGEIHPDFQAIISKAENQSDGFFAAQRKLHEQKLFSAESIGARYIQHFNESYYLIDSVFTGRMTAQSAALLFASTKASAPDLEEAVRNYMRIRFLLALNETSAVAKSIFEANVQAQDLLFHFMRESAAISMIWSAFTSRANPVQNFALLAVRKRESAGKTEMEIKSLFDSIQKSINQTSTNPHTLILFHLLSQKRFEIVVPYSGRKFDSGSLMRNYFAGKIDPILQYTDVTDRFNQFTVVYAFDMGLRTNLFKIVKVDPDFFIADTLRRLNGNVLTDIDQELSAVKTRFNQSLSYEDFKKACAEFDGKPVSRGFYFTEIGESPYYGHVLKDAFISVTDKATQINVRPGGLDITTMGIYYPDNIYSEMLEQSRLDIGYSLRLGKAMLTSYTAQLRREGANESEIESKTKQARQAIATAEAYREKVLTTGKTWLNELGACYWKAFAKDNEIQLKLIAAEKAYLRQVWRDITTLRAKASEAEWSRILGHVKFRGLPSDFKGLDRISENGYVYSSIDMNIRLANYMMHGLTTDEGTIPPIAPGVKIDFGSRLDTEVEAVRSSELQSIAYTEDIEAFVASALKRAFNGNTNHVRKYVTWMGNLSGRVGLWTHYLKSLISLHRLEHEVRGVNKDFTGQMILDSHREILEKLKIGAEERKFLSEIFLVSKFEPNPITLDHRLLLWSVEDNKITDFWGLFDLPVLLMNEEALGDSYEAKVSGVGALIMPRWGVTDLGQMYYQVRSKDNRGASVIPFSRELDRVLDDSVKDFIGGEISLARDFHNLTVSYMKKLEQLSLEERPRADINIYQSIRTPLVSDTVITSWNSKINVFNMNTDSCFISDKTCSSFQQ